MKAETRLKGASPLLLFGAMWMVPLFFDLGSLIRYAFEELRVLVVGVLLGYCRREQKPKETS